MFRVPVDPTSPSFNQTVKVSFWGWLRSSKSQRVEWKSLRNRAAMHAKINQDQSLRNWADRKIEEATKCYTMRERMAYQPHDCPGCGEPVRQGWVDVTSWSDKEPMFALGRWDCNNRCLDGRQDATG